MTRRLHIGGTQPKKGWEILNALPGDHVDHLGNAIDLSAFDDNTFDDIYASHVVEHFGYLDELGQVFIEWWRVLKPGGTLRVSVPDLDILAAAILSREQLSRGDRFYAMQMLFGGQKDEYDFHKVGLNEDFLGIYLVNAGFINLQRVQGFDLFEDTSTHTFQGVPISLNVKAIKPPDGKIPAGARVNPGFDRNVP